MKKSFYKNAGRLGIFLGACLLGLSVFVSCASLQEDVMVSSGEDAILSEADDFEDKLWDFDSAIIKGLKVSAQEMDSFVTGIGKKMTSHTEPVLAARLNALEGLVLQMSGKNKKAVEAYEKAKALHSGDEYVLLLGARLNDKAEDKLSSINEYLSFDSENPLFLLEKGNLLYKTGDYTQAVAVLDKAFLNFDKKDENNKFRERYDEVRNNAWKLHSSGMEKLENIDVSSILSKDKMVLLTMERTGLFEDMLGGTRPSVQELSKKLEAAGYFTAPGDKDGSLNSSSDFSKAKEITRTMCARYLWNAYVRAKGNMKLLNSYSSRFSRLKEPHSPIEDLSLSSIDFDAVLGSVEKGIIDLTDGIFFEGEKTVTELEFIEFLNACENALK